MQSERGRAVLALFGACAFWGSSFTITKALSLFARNASPDMPTWFIAAHSVGTRFLVAAALLAVVRRAAPTRAEWLQGGAIGAVTGLGMLLQVDGLSHTSASVSAFLTQGYVVFLPIATWFLFRQVPSALVVGCASLVLLGLGVLSKFDLASLSMGRGEIETLGAAACFTVQILLVGAERFRDNRPNPMTMASFLGTGLVLMPLLPLGANRASDYWVLWSTPAALACFAVLVLFPTLVSFLLMNAYQRRVGESEAAIIYAMEPVVASASALFIPVMLSAQFAVDYANETLDARLLFGGGLVVGANVLLALGTRKAPAIDAVGAAPRY